MELYIICKRHKNGVDVFLMPYYGGEYTEYGVVSYGTKEEGYEFIDKWGGLYDGLVVAEVKEVMRCDGGGGGRETK